MRFTIDARASTLPQSKHLNVSRLESLQLPGTVRHYGKQADDALLFQIKQTQRTSAETLEPC